MWISAYVPDVSKKYYFEYYTDFQDHKLETENVSCNHGFNGEYEKHIKCIINVKIKNIRTRLFHVSVFNVCFTNFIHEVACKLKKVNKISSQNLILQQQQAQRLKIRI